MGTSQLPKIKQNKYSLKYTQKLGILSRLNTHLIDMILSYSCSDLKDLQEQKLVCGYFAKQLQNRFYQIGSENNLKLQGREWMNDQYLVLDIPKNIDSIQGIMIEVWTKDQGWADGNHSSSWVELRVVGNDEQSCRVATNLRQGNFKKVVKRIDRSNHQQFIDLTMNAKQIALYAKSEYPCWVTHIKKASMILVYKKIE